MNEQERKAYHERLGFGRGRRVDVERLWSATVAARTDRYAARWVQVDRHDLEALLAVVDAARMARERVTPVGGIVWDILVRALEPFTPAEELEHAESPFDVPTVGSNLAFNERMQAEDRRRRLSDLGIELVEPRPAGVHVSRVDVKEMTPWSEKNAELGRRIQAHAERVADLDREYAPQAAPADRLDTAVSDAVSSGAGGRRNSLTGAHDLPHTSAPRPAPSSVERVLVSRDELDQATVALVRERVATHEQRQRAEQAEHDYEQAKRERDAFAEVNVERESARQAAERERDEMKKLADHHLVERQNADHLRERAERERDESRVNGATLALRVAVLVEAVSACVKTWHAHGYTHNHIPDALALSEALAEWDQA